MTDTPITEKTDILSRTKEEISALLSGWGEPRYRAGQIFSWLHRGASFDEMSNLPAKLRQRLAAECAILTPVIDRKLVSAKDGTVKYLFTLHDGQRIESVFMRYHHGNTVCISSQAGCRMGCRFCASTVNGLSRGLLPSELLGQVLAVRRDTGERVSGIVLMGIGEPLDNYENVLRFLRLVGDPEGLNIGYRHISLSTCGIVPKIRALAEEDLPITLSISLHASSDAVRSAIMPVNRKYNIDALLSACKDYFAKTKRRISFEYTLIGGKNDREADALALASLLRSRLDNMPLHVNLIPVNAVKESGFHAPSAAEAQRFADLLTKQGITATVRRKLGSDIDASCGQLRLSAAARDQSV